MPKFSIIIPVYNVEPYLEKCLQSIVNQTFKDFEIIIVNDGSTDNSSLIIEEYHKNYKNIKVVHQENQGLSVARNNGIKIASGEYFLLVDSDDYLELELLEKLKDSLTNRPDIVRFQLRTVSNELSQDYNEPEFTGLNGKEAFEKIVSFKFVENAWVYVYKKSYFMNNHFSFLPNMYHEDFGLIPLVIVSASRVNSISYIGYNYVQRMGSIMNNNDYQKTVKKAYDTLIQCKKIINFDGGNIYKSFLANTAILKLRELKSKEYQEFLFELKKANMFHYILDDTWKRKIKKLILKINPKLYLKWR